MERAKQESSSRKEDPSAQHSGRRKWETRSGSGTLRTPLQRRPPPQTPRRGRRNGPGPTPLPTSPLPRPGRDTDNRSQNFKRTPLQRLANSRQQGTPVQTHLRNRRRNLRREEPGTKGSGGDSRKTTI